MILEILGKGMKNNIFHCHKTSVFSFQGKQNKVRRKDKETNNYHVMRD